jgi:hypothetical protein
MQRGIAETLRPAPCILRRPPVPRPDRLQCGAMFHGDARLDLTDLYAFPKPGDIGKSILIMNGESP